MKNTPSSSPVDSATGLATMLAVAALANPRNVPGSKSIMLDAQVYVGSPSCESLIGALRFYNGNDMEFDSNAGLYLIYATFACMEEGVNIQADMAISAYKFVGDLQWLIPLGPAPDPNSDDFSSEDLEVVLFRIDPRQKAYVHASGMATNCQKEAGTFTLEIEQYITVLKDHQSAVSKPTCKPITPLLCVFPDTPRFRKGKPVPYNKHFVSVSGFLTDVIHKKQSNTEIVEHFIIAVDHIAFLGQAKSHLNDTFPNTLDTSLNTHPVNNGLISYGHNNKRRASSPVPSEADPAPSQKRQHCIEALAPKTK